MLQASVGEPMMVTKSVLCTMLGHAAGCVLHARGTGSIHGFRRDQITLPANENVRFDARPELRSVAEQVSVNPAPPLVDSRSSVVGTLVDSRRVVELPINGRNVIALAELLPGVAAVQSPQTFTGDRDGPTVAVGGSRPNQKLFLFDGAHHNALLRNTGMNYPPPAALQEVKVLTNSFSAEYGRNADAIFNVITKSGTNALHGGPWEFRRNQKMNAAGLGPWAPGRYGTGSKPTPLSWESRFQTAN